MLETTSVLRVLLLFLQTWFASSSVARYPANNNPSSAYAVNNNPASGDITRTTATNGIRPFNVTALGNLTDVTFSVHEHNAYCNNDDDWMNPVAGDFSAADCEDAIKDMVYENWNIDHRLYWSFPGRHDDDHQGTPLKYGSRSCVLAVWPRYLATEDEDAQIRDAEPVGKQHQDVASFHDVATLAYRVFEQCMVTAQHRSLGWVPAGDSNSLFVGFWEADSVLDQWSDGMHSSLPPVVAVT